MSSDVSRLMVEVAVRQALKNRSKQSFCRSLRTLVEYGEHYSSGPFQSNFFLVVQQMLRDDNHPYYQLAERAWTQVDNRYIEHFCLNIGYESWTRGAATIRSLEAELNCNIPWLLTIIRSAPTGAPLAEEAIRALMEQGMRMGIYAYLLVDCQLDTALIHRLSADYATCALSVVSMDSRLTNETLAELEGTDNVMLIAAQDGPTFTSAPFLREHKRLYGLCTFYDSETDLAALQNGTGMACPGDPDCMLHFFLPRCSCDPALRNAMDEELLRLKRQPVSAQFPIELRRDLRHIDQLISTDDCTLSVVPSGEFYLSDPDVPTGMFVQNSSLMEVVREHLKK